MATLEISTTYKIAASEENNKVRNSIQLEKRLENLEWHLTTGIGKFLPMVDNLYFNKYFTDYVWMKKLVFYFPLSMKCLKSLFLAKVEAAY